MDHSSGLESGAFAVARPTKLLFFVTEDWYFCSHRLPLAVAARSTGYDVTVVTRVVAHGETIMKAGLELVPIKLVRRGRNPLAELTLVWRLVVRYRRLKPDIAHHVAMKPALYGALAAWLTGVPHTINAIAGLGWLFTSRSGAARLLGGVVRPILRGLLNRGVTIVQNPDDVTWLKAIGVRAEGIRLIRGSGVDVKEFVPSPEPSGPPVVVLASRLLWDKGIGEFVAAAGSLRMDGVMARFVLVGEPDPANPASISHSQLHAWVAEGAVEWEGRRDDMPSVFANCHVVCLPTFYGEGVPKVLLEAAASGRAIVATDAPGCREIVKNGENGLLVPPRDAKALAEALRTLIEDPDLRRRMGRRGREITEAEFSLDRVIAETLAVYREVRV